MEYRCLIFRAIRYQQQCVCFNQAACVAVQRGGNALDKCSGQMFCFLETIGSKKRNKNSNDFEWNGMFSCVDQYAFLKREENVSFIKHHSYTDRCFLCAFIVFQLTSAVATRQFHFYDKRGINVRCVMIPLFSLKGF